MAASMATQGGVRHEARTKPRRAPSRQTQGQQIGRTRAEPVAVGEPVWAADGQHGLVVVTGDDQRVLDLAGAVAACLDQVGRWWLREGSEIVHQFRSSRRLYGCSPRLATKRVPLGHAIRTMPASSLISPMRIFLRRTRAEARSATAGPVSVELGGRRPRL